MEEIVLCCILFDASLLDDCSVQNLCKWQISVIVLGHHVRFWAKNGQICPFNIGPNIFVLKIGLDNRKSTKAIVFFFKIVPGSFCQNMFQVQNVRLFGHKTKSNLVVIVCHRAKHHKTNFTGILGNVLVTVPQAYRSLVTLCKWVIYPMLHCGFKRQTMKGQGKLIVSSHFCAEVKVVVKIDDIISKNEFPTTLHYNIQINVS